MDARPEHSAGTINRSDVAKNIVAVLLLDVPTSRVLRTCHQVKWASHVAIFWGFIFTAIATILAFFLKPEGTILPLAHPVKIFGNIGGVLLVLGCAAMFFVRYQESGSPWQVTRADLFLLALLSTTVSGFTVQQAIFTWGRTGLGPSAAYWLHIGLVAFLLGTAPYTKFIHALYKPSWLLYNQLAHKFAQRRATATTQE